MTETAAELCVRLRAIADDGDIFVNDGNTICRAVALIEALAKPSSPAGGDVREAVEQAKRETAWALNKWKSTAFTPELVETIFTAPAMQKILIAALSPSTSAAEPVAEDEAAVESAAIRIIRNRASDGPSADRAVAHARQFDTYVWRDAKRDARAALSCSTPPAPAAVGGQRVKDDTLTDDGQARAFDFVAHWHDEQGRRFRAMSEDHPRIDDATCAKAGDASRHHFGSAAALRIRAADIRRARLATDKEGA